MSARIATSLIGIRNIKATILNAGWDVLNAGDTRDGGTFVDVYPPAGHGADEMYSFVTGADGRMSCLFYVDGELAVTTSQLD